jgi:hypothetical protein
MNRNISYRNGKADEDFAVSVFALLALAERVPALFESSGTEEKRKLLAFIFPKLRANGLIYRIYL